MNGQLKMGYAQVSMDDLGNENDIVIHVDAKYLSRVNIEIYCSGLPGKKGTRARWEKINLARLFDIEDSPKPVKEKETKPKTKQESKKKKEIDHLKK